MSREKLDWSGLGAIGSGTHPQTFPQNYDPPSASSLSLNAEYEVIVIHGSLFLGIAYLR